MTPTWPIWLYRTSQELEAALASAHDALSKERQRCHELESQLGSLQASSSGQQQKNPNLHSAECAAASGFALRGFAHRVQRLEAEKRALLERIGTAATMSQ